MKDHNSLDSQKRRSAPPENVSLPIAGPVEGAKVRPTAPTRSWRRLGGAADFGDINGSSPANSRQSRRSAGPSDSKTALSRGNSGRGFTTATKVLGPAFSGYHRDEKTAAKRS
jgi:hypothetical protein